MNLRYIIYLILILFISITQKSYSEDKMSIDDVVKELKSSIYIGMSRSEVRRHLEKLPVTYAYVPSTSPSLIYDNASNNSKIYSRFDVLTAHEQQLTYMKQELIRINFDKNDNVINIVLE